ncbi:hypothetical protein QBC37DRAFT_85521 [Rhypophila decipiens]|uniref:Uncharacterized protein n=1 Tax=Rhypophila decipiens TaxID=261697 RepID=A0AAN6XYG2_9PEZI|nr:hypothetical protein QBC37DRAFT_85521 [Rhypophila decipiens]
MTTPSPNTPPHPQLAAPQSNIPSTTSTVAKSSPVTLTGWAAKVAEKCPFVDGLTVLKAGTEDRYFLKAVDPKKAFLPGQPREPVDKTPSDANRTRIAEYLQHAHLTKEIDSLLKFMRYLFVQTPSFRHIAPLHHQKSRERDIVVDEHPGLHLVWYYQVIFIKPIPAYFFSPSWWAYIQKADKDVFEASLGFMRSYTFLIKYETDYLLACEKHLIPKLLPANLPNTSISNTCNCCQKPTQNEDEKRHPTYEEFSDFLLPFESVSDEECPRRFHYGELRLTRINRTAFITRGKLAYFHIYPQWGQFLNHVLAPVITVFAVSTVVLNSMQVSLAAIDMGPEGSGDTDGWPRFIGLSKWFPIVVMILIAAVVGGGAFALVVVAIKDLLFAEQTRKRKKVDPNAGEKSHGIIW